MRDFKYLVTVLSLIEQACIRKDVDKGLLSTPSHLATTNINSFSPEFISRW